MEDNCVGTTVNIRLGMPTDHIRELYFQSCEYVTYEVSDVVTLRETQIEFQESDLGPVWPQVLGNDLADRSSLSFICLCLTLLCMCASLTLPFNYF